MPFEPEHFREQLLVIDFVAYGKQAQHFFFDTTYEQATKFIWKEICPTAHILFAFQYGLHEPVRMKIKKSKLTDAELAIATKNIDR